MYSSQSSFDLFTRRSLLLGVGKIALGAVMVGRLAYLQLGEAGKYEKLSDKNRIKMRILLPNRGQISDRNGVILALNQKSFNAVLLPEEIENFDSLVDHLHSIIDLSSEDIETLRKTLKRAPKYKTVPLKTGLPWEEVAKLEVHGSHLPGVLIEVGQKRFYPHALETCHVIGYVQKVSQEEKIKEDIPLLAEPGMKIGKTGLERTQDTLLRGNAGAVQKEVDALGRVVQELSYNSSSPGQTLPLTLDFDLQTYAYDLLRAKESGTAIVLHIPTGDVLACASHPSFDGNLFVDGISTNDWKALQEDPYLPLVNRVTQGIYPPGSIFKTVVALAALEYGVDPTSKIHCGGYSTVGSHKFHCWRHKQGHGPMNMTDALKESCDVYFYEVSKRIGIDSIGMMARKLGFGSPTGIELPGDNPGLVPSKDWKLTHKKQNWTLSDTVLSSIGQGYLLATPIQLATLAARLGSQGLGVVPRLMLGEAPVFPSLEINPKHLELVQGALALVSNDPKGTAYRTRIQVPGFELAGKTSSVQVKSISQEERKRGVLKDGARAWKDRDHGMFMGFAPIQNPEFAVAVVIDHGGKGSVSAAPIASALLLKAQQLFRGQEELLSK